MTEIKTEAPAAIHSGQKKFRGLDKVAALLLAVEKPVAARILRHFDEEEIRLVASSAANLGLVSKSLLDDLIGEFTERLIAEGGVQGNPGEAEELLLGVIPDDQVRQIMSDVRARVNEAVWPRLADLPPAILAQYLGKEHPQVAAFVLSKTSAGCAAAVMTQMGAVNRDDIMRRLLSIKLVLDPALRALEDMLRDELLQKISRTSGGNLHAKVADIINKFDKQDMEAVLESLHQHKPKEAKIVKGLLFTFDDIAKLTDNARLALLTDIPPERLIIALRGADQGLREIILSAVPLRTRRIIEQELASTGSPPHKEIQKARRAIADLALEMAERGMIELKPGVDS